MPGEGSWCADGPDALHLLDEVAAVSSLSGLSRMVRSEGKEGSWSTAMHPFGLLRSRTALSLIGGWMARSKGCRWEAKVAMLQL